MPLTASNGYLDHEIELKCSIASQHSCILCIYMYAFQQRTRPRASAPPIQQTDSHLPDSVYI